MMHAPLKNLYLRREPTADPVLLEWAPDAAQERLALVLYHQQAAPLPQAGHDQRHQIRHRLGG